MKEKLAAILKNKTILLSLAGICVALSATLGWDMSPEIKSTLETVIIALGAFAAGKILPAPK